MITPLYIFCFKFCFLLACILSSSDSELLLNGRPFLPYLLLLLDGESSQSWDVSWPVSFPNRANCIHPSSFSWTSHYVISSWLCSLLKIAGQNLPEYPMPWEKNNENLRVKGVGKTDHSLSGVNLWSGSAVHEYNYSDKINGIVLNWTSGPWFCFVREVTG